MVFNWGGVKHIFVLNTYQPNLGITILFSASKIHALEVFIGLEVIYIFSLNIFTNFAILSFLIQYFDSISYPICIRLLNL